MTYDDGARPNTTAIRPEPKPWVLYTHDGRLNPGSYGYTATISMVELAYELVEQQEAMDAWTVRVSGSDDDESDVTDGTSTDLLARRLRRVKSLARTLLEAADRAQATVHPEGRVDRMEMSHSRARGAVRTALRGLPVPWDADANARSEWADQLGAHAADILLLTYELYREHDLAGG